MCLPVTLDLRGFVERLPAGSVLGIFTVDSFAIERFDNRKHAAIAEIAVMRQSENLGARLLLAHRHPLPEVTRIGTSKRRLGSERLDKAGLYPIVAPDDVAMKIVSAGIRGPFIANESGEVTRIVGFFRGLDRFAPC